MSVKFEKLTRTHLRKLAVGEKLDEHGISFERLSNGDGRFTINIMVDGQRIHRVAGKESEGMTRQQVEELIAKLRTDSRHGRLNLPKGRKTVFSFKEAAEKYFERQEMEGAKNITPKRTHLNFHLIPFFKGMQLNALSASDIERYKNFRLEQLIIPKEKKNPDKTEKNKEPRYVKPATINRELSTLSHLFTQAVEWGWLDKNPAKIKKFKEEQTRIVYLTLEQINRLYEEAKKDENLQIYPFIVIGIGTSMRKMEILSIRIADIDLNKLVIYLPKAKAGGRQQPITKKVAECLREYLKTLASTDEWLFPSQNSITGHTVNH